MRNCLQTEDYKRQAHEQKKKKKKERKVFPGYGNIWAEASPFSFDLPYCIANGRDESIFFFIHSI